MLMALKDCPAALDRILAKLSLSDLSAVASIGEEYQNLVLRLPQSRFEQLKKIPDLHAPDSVLPIGVKSKFTKGDVVAHVSGWIGIVMGVASYASVEGELREIDLDGTVHYGPDLKKRLIGKIHAISFSKSKNDI